MSKDAKLLALRTTCEVEEQLAFEQKKKVDTVVEQRQQAVLVLSGSRDSLAEKLKRLVTLDRQTALHAGDALQLVAITQYEKRLKGEIEKLSRELQERTRELELALTRARIAEEDLRKARVEKRKIEKYLEDWQRSERIRHAAIEEVTTDEMNSYKNRK